MERNKFSRISTVLIFASLCLLSVTFVIPFAYMFISSVKTTTNYLQDPFGWPTEFVWSNFQTMISQFEIQRFMLNSLLISLGTIIIMTMLGIVASYIFAKRPFPGSGGIYLIIIFTMFMPAQVTLIPLYIMFARMGLVNNLWSVIICFVVGGLPSCIMLMTSYFRSIPNEVCESAMIDGCNFIGVIRNVIIPMGKPAIATNTIFVFLSTWNDLFTPLVLLTDRDKQSVMVALNSLVSRYASDPTFQFAGLTIVTIPMLIVYLFAQRHLIEGINAGAIK